MNTIKIVEGSCKNAKGRYAIAVARFNSFVVDRLQDGALQALKENGVQDQDIVIVKVPGAFELPLAAQKLASGEDFNAVIALGAVIRGGTPHFEYVAGACVDGLNQVALQTHKPVVFGVLTVDNIEQATERAGGKMGNKGAEAALTALEMVSLLRQLES